jgi:hypothetical protein
MSLTIYQSRKLLMRHRGLVFVAQDVVVAAAPLE